MFHSYQVDQSISVLRVDWWYFSIRISIENTYANSKSTYQTPPLHRSAASDLGLHCLRLSHKRTPGLYWLIMIILVITNVTVYDKNDHFKKALTCTMFKNFRNIQHIYKYQHFSMTVSCTCTIYNVASKI